LRGVARWNALARAALAECLGESAAGGAAGDAPLVIASCNGAAHQLSADEWAAAFDSRALLDGTPWQGRALPVLTGSCASGLQALYAARALLAAGSDPVYLLAVDVLSRAAHENFEVMRVLAPAQAAPWQPQASGFLLGEAAVALRLSARDH